MPFASNRRNGNPSSLVFVASPTPTDGVYCRPECIQGQEFFGKKVVLFYEKKFGLFPYYNNSDPNQPVNGGLPQNASLSRHLNEVVKQILTKIPDHRFDGLAVIDLEEWRPLYDMNWGDKEIYKEQSVKHVMAENTRLTRNLAEVLAQRDFNEAAR
ncbi:hyaluronoglucosaminidase [Teladorsagia circumcincta]|uniref:Hyaluronidase n=1 Tax=Teladorsagia circumcincta TaxID=45464 RepID=A0A2G9U971_TELCI|nr:hyaluronoglucosaminidase [Teladorsagia circumcincta]